MWCTRGLPIIWSLKGEQKTSDFTGDFTLKLMVQHWINFLFIFLIFGSNIIGERLYKCKQETTVKIFLPRIDFSLQYKQWTMGGCRGGSERTLEFWLPSHLHSYVKWHALWNGSWHVITKNKNSLKWLAQVTSPASMKKSELKEKVFSISWRIAPEINAEDVKY